MNGEIRVVDDVCAAFTDLVVETFRNKPEPLFNLCLSGGPTARKCYERLAAEAAEAIDWFEVEVYWGDERCVPPDHEDSNERLVREALLERVGGAHAVHPMRADEGAEAYQLRVGEVDWFDFTHLGMGPDGHTASLFPGSAGLDADPGKLVVLNEDPNGVNPYQRITLTLSGIAKSRLAVFTVAGASKRETFAKLLAGEDYPAARVTAEKIVWLVDHEAYPEG